MSAAVSELGVVRAELGSVPAELGAVPAELGAVRGAGHALPGIMNSWYVGSQLKRFEEDDKKEEVDMVLLRQLEA